MSNHKKMKISSLIWGQNPEELLLSQGKAIENLGHTHCFFRFDETIPPATQIIFVQGPYKTLLPLIDQLIKKPVDERPVLVYWFQQSLHLLQPRWAGELVSRTFSELHQKYSDLTGIGKLTYSLAPDFFKMKGARLGFLGDILWLNEHNLLDVLALSSTVYAHHLEQYSIPSIVVPRGSAPSYGSFLNFERDIAVVWMGKLRTMRRRKVIYWLKQELEKKGLAMHIYDGENEGFIYGQKRAEILNRAWFVLNVFFSGPTDELSIRFFIAGANGAVVLTEPGANQYPFIPGKHILVSQVEQMPEVIEYFLNNKNEWQTIADNMNTLIRNELTLEKSIAQILAIVSLHSEKPAKNCN